MSRAGDSDKNVTSDCVQARRDGLDTEVTNDAILFDMYPMR